MVVHDGEGLLVLAAVTADCEEGLISGHLESTTRLVIGY